MSLAIEDLSEELGAHIDNIVEVDQLAQPATSIAFSEPQVPVDVPPPIKQRKSTRA